MTRPLDSQIGRAVALHSLGWLVAANGVGLWLAVLLLWPDAGAWMAPWTWGRWASLHMNWQLYGWCALPLVGALFSLCLQPATDGSKAQLALTAWSAALALGGLAWLGGCVSGKLFLDWHGWTRPLLPLVMVGLWGVLALSVWRSWPRLDFGGRLFRALVLTLLAPTPAVLYWAFGRGMYHPINPDSGGATGAAVLGSTLGIITILMAAPHMLHVPRRRTSRAIPGALVLSWVVFACVNRGNVSHHDRASIVALGTLFAWIPLLPLYWRGFAWPAGASLWLAAASGWWAILVSTGWLSYLPHVSEALKFTHALVGHAHLAMAALVTSFHAAILVTLTRRAPPTRVFALWQFGCVMHIAALLALGWGEMRFPSALFRADAWTDVLMGVRLLGGISMGIASVLWLKEVVRS